MGVAMKRELRLEGNRGARFNHRPMGLLSLFKSKPETPADAAVREATADPAPARITERWRKAPFAAFVAGEDQHVVHRRGQLPVLVPSFAIDFALALTEFEPMEKHLAKHAELHAWGSLEIESLRSWLPKMIESGLLISAREVQARGASLADPQNKPAPISAIGFPTGGDRVPMLARAMRSFAGNVRTAGRTVDWLVADSSPKADQRGLFRAQTEALGREFGQPVRYLGLEEKQHAITNLIKGSGCRPEAAEFALFDPIGAGFACGANRNALLLHEAGGLLSSVDDDVICELAAVRPAATRLALFSNGDPYQRSVFPDRTSALDAVRFAPHDYLAEHERVLGRDLGALLGADFDPAALDLEHLGDDLLRRLEGGSARVRTTFLGYVGDPGIPTSCYFFFHKGKNRERLTESEADYHAGFGSRSVLNHAASLAIGDGGVAPGMAMGFDHRELLPPFFPVLHAEDVIFGATTWHCCTGAVSGHLPLIVHHDSGLGKPTLQPGDLTDDRRVAVFEFAQIIRSLIANHAPAEHADTAARLRRLGRHLSEFAALPDLDFREALHRVILDHESREISFLEESLRTETDAPEFWRRDMQSFLDHSREALLHQDFDIPYELKASRPAEENRTLMKQLIGRYGQLLEDWPAMVEVAREFRTQGRPLFSSRA
jgi:hypothetical protein